MAALPSSILLKMLNNKIILITGGTGSLGKALTKRILDKYNPKSLRIFSRDELKQWEMSNNFSSHPKFKKLRFFLGDVRDRVRTKRAFEGVDYIIHAAALKQIPAAEYNPMECIKTNVIGAQNVIDAALDNSVKGVVAISTDKAAGPVNLYGATKLCAEKLFVAANNSKGGRKLNFSVVRYGNVMGSRGSVIPFFIKQKGNGIVPITHPDMTRFNITLNAAVDLVLFALQNSFGGEIIVPKLPSYKITDVAKAIDPKGKMKVVGIRPGEKMHEEMITEAESNNVIEINKYYVILPPQHHFNPLATAQKYAKKFKVKQVKPGFRYSSGANTEWLTVSEIRKLVSTDLVS